MIQSEMLELIKQGKFAHKECCMFKKGLCVYFLREVNPNHQACLNFVTCNECSSRAVRVWNKFIKKINKK